MGLALKRDANPVLLGDVVETMDAVRTRIATGDERVKLNAVVRAEFGPVYAALPAGGKENDNDPKAYAAQQVRATLFEELGEAGDPAVLAQARQITAELFAGKRPSEPNLADAAVALTASNGDEAFYDRIMTVNEKASDPENKDEDPGLASEALQMLTRFRDPKLVVETLLYATSGKVRNQDSWELIAAEMSQAETRDLAWTWVRANWGKVQAQLTTASGGNVVSATGSFCTVEQREEVQRFFAAHKVEASERALSKAVDSINACIDLRKTQEPKLREWLAGRESVAAVR